MKMDVSSEYLVGSWTVSISYWYRAIIYLVSANGENEIVNFSCFEAAPK